MTIQVRGANATGAQTTSPATIDVSGIGIQENDLVFLHVRFNTNIAPTSLPTGFTLVSGSVITPEPTIHIYSKVATAGEPSSYEVGFVPGNCRLGVLVVYSDTSDTLQINAVSKHTSSGTTYTWNGVSTSSENALLACFASITNFTSTTPQTGMITRYNLSGNDVMYCMTGYAADAGGTGTRTATGSSMLVRTVMIAVIEASQATITPTPGAWWTDFSEYPLGDLHTNEDWEEKLSNPGSVNRWEIVADAGATGGKVARFDQNDTQDGISIAWLTPGVVLDGEVLTRVRVDTDQRMSGACLRLTETGSYWAAIRIGFPSAIWRFDGNEIAELDTGPSQSVDTWYWLRFNVTGTTLKAKIWEDGTTEPTTGGPDDDGFQMKATDTFYASGYTGISGPLGDNVSTTGLRDNDIFSLGVEESAPIEEPPPPPPPPPPGDVGIPTHLRAIVTSERSVYLEFDDSRVLPDATGYHWQVSPDGEAWSTLTSTAIGVTGFTHAADPETTYYYRVQATPGGEWSNVTQATRPPAVIPGGRGLWIDIENAAGTKLGEGPLLEVTRARVTYRLDRAGDFEFELPLAYRRGAQATTSRYARIHARLKDRAEEVFYGPIEQIGRRMSADREMRTVGGANVARELALAKVWARIGNVNFLATPRAQPTYQVTYDDADDAPQDLVSNYAPSNWTLSGELNTAVDWTGEFYYDAVLDALARVGEETGEHFRVGLTREVEWLGRLQPGAPASGVRAVHGVSLDDSFEHDEICLVTHVEEVLDGWGQVTRVHVSGGDFLGHPLTPFEATRAPHGGALQFGEMRYMKSAITHVFGDGAKVTLTLADDLPAASYKIFGDIIQPSGVAISMIKPGPFLLEFDDTTTFGPDGYANPVGGAWIHHVQTLSSTDSTSWSFVDWSTGTDVYHVNNPFHPYDPTDLSQSSDYAVYLWNQTVEQALGVSREAHVSFPHIVPREVSIQAEVAAANQLLATAFNWLRTRVRPERFYRVTVTGLERMLDPGETIRLSIHRFFDGVQFFNIEADLLILEASYDFDQTGIAQADLLVGTTDRYPSSDVETLILMEEQVESRGGGGPVALRSVGGMGLTKPVLHESEGDTGALMLWRSTGWDAAESIRYRLVTVEDGDPVEIMPDGAVDHGLWVSAIVAADTGAGYVRNGYAWQFVELGGSDALFLASGQELRLTVNGAGGIVIQRVEGGHTYRAKILTYFE